MQILPGPGTWNGTWSANNDGSNPTAFTVTGPGAGSSANAGHYTSGAVTSYANLIAYFVEPPNAGSYEDLSAYTGVVFDVQSDAGNGSNLMYVDFGDADTDPNGGICSSCNDYHRAAFCLPASGSGYKSVTVFFNQLSQSGWGTPQVAFDKTRVYNIEFAFPANAAMGVWLDNIHLTTAAPPPPLGAFDITDFETGGTQTNPNMTNYLAGNNGITDGVSGTPSALLSPTVDCGGYNSNFAAHINATWTSDTNYKGTQLTANLSSGVLASDCATSGVNYFNIGAFPNGVQFDIKVVAMNSTGTPPTFDFSVGTSNTLPACTWEGGGLLSGDCGCGGAGAWDTFTLNNFASCSNAVPSGTGALPGSGLGTYPAADNTWHTYTVYWTDLARQSWGDPMDPTCGWTFDWSYVDPPTPMDPANGYINQSCYSNQIMYLQWGASSGTNLGNDYTVEFWVDNVKFF